jgi:transposase InsO family protein
MIYPLVRDLSASGVLVVVTCRVLRFTPQAFYKWCKRPVSDRDWHYAHLVEAARQIHADDPVFGYRFIADGLAACHGIERARTGCIVSAASTASSPSLLANGVEASRAAPPMHDDLVPREFTAAAPNVMWFTDITEHPTVEGRLYLCFIKDAFSNRIVGLLDRSADEGFARRSGSSKRNRASGSHLHRRAFGPRQLVPFGQVTAACAWPRPGRIDGSNRSVCRQHRYGVLFALRHKDVLDRRRWTTREELRLEIVNGMERAYHRRRRQRALGKLNPVEFEKMHAYPLEVA